MDLINSFIDSFSTNLGGLYTTVARWIFVILALHILIIPIKSLLRSKNPAEIWGYLSIPGNISIPIKHWENVIGRASSCDVIIDVMSVSRNHGTLVRDEDGNWFYNDLGSKSGSMINGRRIRGSSIVEMGDKITVGGVECVLVPASLEEEARNKMVRRKLTKVVSPWGALFSLTLFQIMTVIQFYVAKDFKLSFSVPLAFGMITAAMWLYCIILSRLGKRGFEIEIIAFFLSTLSLAVATTWMPPSMPMTPVKQSAAILIGMGLFIFMCWFLRDLSRVMAIRKFLVIASVLLFLVNILFAERKFGAANWIAIPGIGMKIQPSELVKIAFITIGAATLDELYEKVNLTLFIGFSLFSVACLAIMNDLGTASIFFVTYLVISFLRSGDFSKLFLVIGAAGIAGVLAINFKGHILTRFVSWRHAWESEDIGAAYQQTRAMSAGASGGLVGVGAGEGWLQKVGAADTDLVFGLLCEEWGLIIACLAVLSIITLAVFAIRSIGAGRSAFYTITACAATTLLVFQTILNVCGAEDILPLTGVTFPLVSNGGSSMISTWGMLAFLKAADTRQNASLAVINTEGEDL